MSSIRWVVWLALSSVVVGCSGDAGPDLGPDLGGDTSNDAEIDPEIDAEIDPEIDPPIDLDLVQWVDPMIGTDGPGNVIPGALVPHGMVRASPDTESGPGSIDAYEHGDPRIEGFTHTNLEGPGGSNNGTSQLLVVPTDGPLDDVLADTPSAFSHDSEEASPGYYAVTLEDYGVRAELTAGARAAVHRYTWGAASGEARVLVDLAHSNGQAVDAAATVVDAQTVEGWATFNLHPLLEVVMGSDEPTGEATLYFVMSVDTPSSEHGFFKGSSAIDAADGDDEVAGTGVGLWLGFEVAADQAVEVRVGISYVSVAQAWVNLDADVGELSFEGVRDAASAAWNARLNRVQIEGGTDARRRTFYTALYHAMFQPSDHTEAGGVYHLAADGVGEVFESDSRRFFTEDWCMWDTYRTSHPLATLVEPETRDDVVWSMIRHYEQGGWLPKCTWHASGYSRVMIGHHAVSIIADAAVKGLVSEELLDLAWEATWKHAISDNPNPGEDTGLCGYFNLGTQPDYIALGWVPSACDSTQSVSMTLEYAFDDWASAHLAEWVGESDAQQTLLERAQNWKNHWNPDVGWMQGRRADGSWVEPFDPGDWSDDNDFAEATSWIYSFFVPHDVSGLIEVMGGPAAFVERLDSFFDDGHYDPSNQPSFHIPFLYNDGGAPAKAQAKVREVLDTEYGDGVGGLPGNDDAGSTSAWYVLGALGLYPVAPGGPPVYHLVAPRFDRATIRLPGQHYDGGAFVIEAIDQADDHPFVQSATLNGEPFDRLVLTHDEIVAGGTLSLVLGPEPSTWGTVP